MIGIDDPITSLNVMAGGAIIAQSKSTDAPPTTSLQLFCAAIFSTILPALIDKPMAMLQWLALRRTALELESRYGWHTASQYITQLLNERVPQSQGFVDVSPHVLESVRMAPRLQYGGGGHAASSGPPARAQGGTGTCHNWNRGLPCASSPCIFAHVCVFRAEKSCIGNHKGTECPKKPPSFGSGGTGATADLRRSPQNPSPPPRPRRRHPHDAAGTSRLHWRG